MKHTTFQTQIYILPKAAMPKIYANFEYIPLLPFDPELLAHLFFKPPARWKKHLLYSILSPSFCLIATNSCGGVAAVTRVFQRADDKSYFRQVLFYFITYSSPVWYLNQAFHLTTHLLFQFLFTTYNFSLDFSIAAQLVIMKKISQLSWDASGWHLNWMIIFSQLNVSQSYSSAQKIICLFFFLSCCLIFFF